MKKTLKLIQSSNFVATTEIKTHNFGSQNSTNYLEQSKFNKSIKLSKKVNINTININSSYVIANTNI